jgi:hypothetical protein
VFEGLDFVLAEAHRRSILVILTLVNYWGDYGGMPQVCVLTATQQNATVRPPFGSTLGAAPVQQPLLRPHRCINRVYPTCKLQCSAELPTYLPLFTQYAKWSAAARGADPGCAKSEHFYTDPWAQNIFRNYLATLTARVNSFTGIAYRCL